MAMGRSDLGGSESRGLTPSAWPWVSALAFAVVSLGACSSSSGSSAELSDGIRLDEIELSPGFEIRLVTDDVPGARSLAMSPGGVLYVGTRDEGVVYAVEDPLSEDRATVTTIASDLSLPNGVAWHDGSLFVAEKTRILRFDDLDSRIDDPPDPVVVVDGFPDEEVHGWRFIRFGPDGLLYVPVGSPCNICESDDPIYGSITRMDPMGHEREIFAHGIRNTVGFDWHPETSELWFTDNGADGLGDDRPPDELNHADEPGLHFGYPFCHGGDLLDPELGAGRSCDDFVAPAIDLGPHVAALGMRFYDGESFPSRFRGQVFIAEHGSWDRSEPIGYRITMVGMEGGNPLDYSVFADGWLQGDEAWGRPVDVEVALDGSLLVSDDEAGAIYRIVYQPDT